MIEPTSRQWCTTLHNCATLVECTANIVTQAWRRDREPSRYKIGDIRLFVGFVPKTSGRNRPAHRFVFLVIFNDDRNLICGNDLSVIAQEMADILRSDGVSAKI